MLRALALSVQALLLGLIAYNLLTALWGWRVPAPARPGARRGRFRVVVPAHDEEAVVGRLLGDLAAQEHPPELVEVWVVADRCTDRTAGVAREAGARVAERAEGPEGKGAALAWYLERHPLEADEALVVLDADTRVPPGLLARLDDELEAGHRALQACLDVANPDASWLATASALSYWASNRMVQLARRNLGWSADLGGTGMCLTPGALAAAGGFGASLAEDQDLTARLVLAGIPVVWLHDLRVRDEKPVRLGVAARQRVRWASGWREAGRRWAGALVRAALQERRWAPADLAVRLLQPGRSFLALVSGALLVAAAVRPGWPLVGWQVWAGAVAAQLGLPFAFLVREGVPGRYLARYPAVAVFGLLWLPVRLLARRSRGWYHTPHGG